MTHLSVGALACENLFWNVRICVEFGREYYVCGLPLHKRVYMRLYTRWTGASTSAWVVKCATHACNMEECEALCTRVGIVVVAICDASAR